MLCSRSARAVVHVRRVPEVAVHPAVDLGRERRPRVALVREVPDEGPEGLLGARPPPRQPKEDPLFTHLLFVHYALPIDRELCCLRCALRAVLLAPNPHIALVCETLSRSGTCCACLFR